MNKPFIIIIFLLAGVIFIGGIISFTELILIRYQGIEITAIVKKVEIECDKYNHIEVLYANKLYEINISSEECHKGVYKIGQEVTLLKHENFEKLIWPASQPGWILIIMLCLLTYSITMVIRTSKYSKRKNKAHA